MEATVWSLIAEKGFNVAFMAVFCYLVWKHFTKDKEKDAFLKKEEREWFVTINRELRAENRDLATQIIEMNKLMVETSINLLHQQRDVITIVTSMEDKLDKLVKKP